MAFRPVNPAGRTTGERSFNFNRAEKFGRNTFSRSLKSPLEPIQQDKAFISPRANLVHHSIRSASVRNPNAPRALVKLSRNSAEIAHANDPVPSIKSRLENHTQSSKAKVRSRYQPSIDLPRPRVIVKPLSAREQSIINRLNGTHTVSSEGKIRQKA